MSGVSQLRATELAILNAPFEERGWERAVGSIAHATGSSGAHLLGMGGPLLFPLNVIFGDYRGYEPYFTDPRLHGRCNWRVAATTEPMAIQHEAHYTAYRQSNPTSDYDDAVSDLDIPFGCQSAMFLDRNGMIGLALLRSGNDGPCGPETLRAFAVLRHQLARAIRVQMALDGEAAELMVGDIGAMTSATILLDRHGCLAALTAPAEELFEEKGPVRLAGLEVRLSHPEEDRQLHRAAARLLGGDEAVGPIVHEMRAGRTAEFPRGRWRLSALRLPRRKQGLGFEPELALAFHPLAA